MLLKETGCEWLRIWKNADEVDKVTQKVDELALDEKADKSKPEDSED